MNKTMYNKLEINEIFNPSNTRAYATATPFSVFFSFFLMMSSVLGFNAYAILLYTHISSYFPFTLFSVDFLYVFFFSRALSKLLFHFKSSSNQKI